MLFRPLHHCPPQDNMNSTLNPYARSFTPSNRITSVEKKRLLKKWDNLMQSHITIKKLSDGMKKVLVTTMTAAVKKMVRISGTNISCLLKKWVNNMFLDKMKVYNEENQRAAINIARFNRTITEAARQLGNARILVEKSKMIALKKMARIAGKRLSFLIQRWDDNMFWEKEDLYTESEDEDTNPFNEDTNPFALPAESDSEDDDTDSDYELSDTQSEDSLEIIDAPALLPDDY